MSHSSTHRQTYLVPVTSETIDALASGASPAELATGAEPDLSSLHLSAPPVWSTNTTAAGKVNHILYSDLEGIWTWWGVDEHDMEAMMAVYTAGLTPGKPKIDPTEVFPIVRSPEEESLIAAIVADPDEDAPRLEYADWLEARGDARGELIRVQLAMEHCHGEEDAFPRLWERAQELLFEHGQEWFRPLAALNLWPTLGPEFCPEFFMSRGFLESIWVHVPNVLPEHAEALWSFAPTLNSLAFFDTVDVVGLTALPQLRRLRELSLLSNDPETGEQDMTALAECPYFTRLESLAIGYELNDAAATALFDAPWLGRLRELDLQRAQLSAAAIEKLTAHEGFIGLQSLELSGPGVTEQAVIQLSENPAFRGLASLRLTEAPIAGPAFRELMLGAWPTLEDLDLSACGLRDDDVEFLANSPTIASLEALNLRGSTVAADGAAALAASPYLTSLTSIDVDREGLEPEDVEMLTARFGDALTLHD